MGFMDKAKKLAEQAQQKLDDAQNQFNQGAAPQAPPEGSPQVRYDEHGRPVQDAPTPDPAAPAAAAPAPAGDAPTPDPAAPPAADDPTSEPRDDDTPSGDANTTPDPFRPIQ